VKDISDPTYVAELVEFAETMLNELQAIRLRIFDKANAVLHAGVHELVGLADDLMVEYRKLANLEEALAELVDARAVPAVVDTFEEVDR
jgi:hypothetical protein